MSSARGQIIRIGNGNGIKIPKSLLEKASLPDQVELIVSPGRLVIKGKGRPRRGWAEAAKLMHARSEDAVLDDPTPTRFDEEEWEWDPKYVPTEGGKCASFGWTPPPEARCPETDRICRG